MSVLRINGSEGLGWVLRLWRSKSRVERSPVGCDCGCFFHRFFLYVVSGGLCDGDGVAACFSRFSLPTHSVLLYHL
jgi:hypothetical protein